MSLHRGLHQVGGLHQDKKNRAKSPLPDKGVLQKMSLSKKSSSKSVVSAGGVGPPPPHCTGVSTWVNSALYRSSIFHSNKSLDSYHHFIIIRTISKRISIL